MSAKSPYVTLCIDDWDDIRTFNRDKIYLSLIIIELAAWSLTIFHGQFTTKLYMMYLFSYALVIMWFSLLYSLVWRVTGISIGPHIIYKWIYNMWCLWWWRFILIIYSGTWIKLTITKQNTTQTTCIIRVTYHSRCLIWPGAEQEITCLLS